MKPSATLHARILSATLILTTFAAFDAHRSAAYAQGTAFTYQGELNTATGPASGNFDFTFTLFNIDSGGSPLAGPLTNSAIALTDGIFTTTLDFGPAFAGADCWLEIAVRTNGAGPFAALSPRQPITPSPYSIIAGDVTSPEVARLSANGSQVFSGTNYFTGANLFNGPSNTFLGIFTGDGGALSNLNPANLSGTLPDSHLSTNVGLLNASQTYTGQNTFASQSTFTGPVNVNTLTPSSLLTIAGDAQLAGPAVYQHFQLSGGNSTGFLYGSYAHFGDGIHLGYNYYADANGTNHIINSGGGTSRISVGYGSILLATQEAGQGEPYNRLYVQDDGAVGIATTSPASGFTLDVNGATLIEDATSIYGTLSLSQVLYAYSSAYKPGGGSWSVLSDQRLKKNIQPLTGVLDNLLKLHGVSFEYKEPEKIHELPGVRIGMIAQEVEKVFPDWIATRDDGYKSVTYRGFEALTVEALRELRSEKDAQIAALENQNAKLEKALADQNNILAQIQSRLDNLEKSTAHPIPTLADERH